MQTENLTVQQAIELSSQEDRIVHLDWRLGAERDLRADCEGEAQSDDEMEFWGGDEDGDTETTWRVHLHGAPTPGKVACECGEVCSNSGCGWTGSEDETVVVEWMPAYLRESHRAAGNSGVYPHNGAQQSRLERSCAEAVCAADPDWCRILE